MKEKARKIVTRVMFAAFIIVAAYTAYRISALVYVSWLFSNGTDFAPGTAVLSISGTAIAVVIMIVFLALCLAFKGKHKLF